MNKRDVKSGVVGAALTALAFVAVYEGKVAVSHAGERVDLGAGESAQAGAGGVSTSGALGEGEKAFDAKVAASASEPLTQANENLVSQVGEYRRASRRSPRRSASSSRSSPTPSRSSLRRAPTPPPRGHVRSSSSNPRSGRSSRRTARSSS